MTEIANAKAVKFALSVSRPEAFGALFLAAFLNAHILTFSVTLASNGLAGALLQGFGVNWVVWAAVALCAGLILKARPEPAARADWLVLAACAVLLVWPTARLAMAAITLLAAYIYFSKPKDDYLRAAAMIMAAISVNGLWADVAILFFGAQILAFDTYMVSWLMDVPASSNVLTVDDGVRRLTIGMECSFVSNASIALLLWIAITRAVRPIPLRQELYYGLAVFLSVIAINTIRISFMTVDPYWVILFHQNTGAQYITLAMLTVTLAITAYSLRHELAR
jgi:hypothetical protein